MGAAIMSIRRTTPPCINTGFPTSISGARLGQNACTCNLCIRVRPFSPWTAFVKKQSMFPTTFLGLSFPDSYGRIQGGEVRLDESSFQKMCRVQENVEGDGDQDDPGSALERRTRCGQAVPQKGPAHSGSIFRATLDRDVQVVSDDGHQQNGSAFYRDSRFRVI